MQQPELGKLLFTLRKEKNLTQEELVEKSHVSVRTIQRIENGEVLPRRSTVKILLEALGVDYESFSVQLSQTIQAPGNTSLPLSPNTILIAALAGVVYLICQITLGAMDIAWVSKEKDWGLALNTCYISLTAIMVVSYALFARGFIALGILFQNNLLITVSYMLIVATLAMGIFNITSLSVDDIDQLILPYAVAYLLLGSLSIAFGVALCRLQDSMGELARAAGILEFITGLLLITVVLFLFAYVFMIPSVVVEILVLYKGYEYLSKSQQVYNESNKTQ